MTERQGEDAGNVPASDETVPGYEAPAVEMALTGKELEREVHYAGNAFSF